METTAKLTAFLIANQLDTKGIRSFLGVKPQADSPSELFYRHDGEKYQYYFNYGVIVFCGYTETEMKDAILAIAPFQKNPLPTPLRDEFDILKHEGTEPTFGFDGLQLSTLDNRSLRIVMFSLAQSVAIDYYHNVAEDLLSQVKKFTNQLEIAGTLKISRKNMLRFIGKALNTQNEIAENIYIFDAPDLVWDDQYLDKLHQGLIKHFDLRIRFNEIEYTLRIIKDNLAVFREITHQRESNFLEWIIIVLILVEVFNILITKIFGLFS